jgi:cytochrome P450
MTISPDVQRKLRAHILEVMPEIQDRPPTFEDLTPGKLPYLEAVVQETLRLSRTAGGYSREGTFSVVFSPSSITPSLSGSTSSFLARA